MNGYRKMRLLSTTKSQSVDFSDIFSQSQTPKSTTTLDPTPLSPPEKPTNKHPQTTHDPVPIKEEEEDGGGKIFGIVLSRNGSVSSTASQRFKADKENPTIQSAVKRACSLRRSTSVSEGYCRIYDHSDPTLCSPIDDNEDANFNMQTKIKKKKKKGSRILRACRNNYYCRGLGQQGDGVLKNTLGFARKSTSSRAAQLQEQLQRQAMEHQAEREETRRQLENNQRQMEQMVAQQAQMSSFLHGWYATFQAQGLPVPPPPSFPTGQGPFDAPPSDPHED